MVRTPPLGPIPVYNGKASGLGSDGVCHRLTESWEAHLHTGLLGVISLLVSSPLTLRP